MNLAEALVAALPEMPTRVIAKKNYKLNPDVVVREQLNENEEPVVVILNPATGWLVRVTPEQYRLLLLFNGERSFADVAQEYTDQSGSEVSEEDVRTFAANLAEYGLWFQSQQERNIALSQKISEERRKRINQKGKYSDLAHIGIKGFNPDAWLGRLHDRLWWIYTPWFTALTLVLFAYMTWVWVQHWSEIGRDSLLYYTFTQKTGWDLAEFWILFFVMAFFHETAHGLTSKHFGAGVTNMGFQLIYLAPAFATEVAEIFVKGGRRERIWTIAAGLWMEAILCGLATVIWLMTVAGSAAHEWAYKVMLITGLITLIVNLNPLIKLDGYYLLAEAVGISDLKENSTAYVSGWVKKHIYRLPVEVDYVPPRRRLLYVPFALLSGVYSYFILLALSRLTYNIFSKWFGQWALFLAGLVALKIFYSRILRLAAFMKSVYLDKRASLKTFFTPARTAMIAAVLLLACFLPVFPRTTTALFILEPTEKAVVRALAAGQVQRVLVREDSRVAAGEPVLVMRNIEMEGQEARAAADVDIAKARQIGAQLTYASLGPTQNELRRATQNLDAAKAELKDLVPVSPMNGVVTTPRVENLAGTYVAAGSMLMEIENLANLRARIYIPEFSIAEVKAGQPVALRLKSLWKTRKGVVQSVAVAPSELSPGLEEPNKYKGLVPPPFYIADLTLPNPGALRAGMSGEAKIFIGRESLAMKLGRGVREIIGRQIW